MDIRIYGIDDIQYTDETDQQDQTPCKQLNLRAALRKLSVRFLIGHPCRSGNARAESVKRAVKCLPVRARTQDRAKLRIHIRAGQLRIEPVTHKHLQSVAKTVVPDAEIALVAVQRQQHLQLFPGYGDRTALRHTRRPCLQSFYIDRERIADDTALPSL